MTTDPHVSVVTVPQSRRWQWWRDLVILLLAVAVVALCFVMVQQGNQQDARYAAATEQRDRQSAQLDVLSAQVVRLTADNANKDGQIAGQAQTIRMLTAILQREGISIPASLQQRVQAGTTPSRAPSAAPSAQPSAPSTTPPSSAPSTTPQPIPTPTPSPTDSSLVGGVTSLLCLLVPFAC